ncbi:hypothetical protein P308_08485 [Pseudomonas piscis]|nr:hypothetical protein P308_08485 [Pseudomonas piscis]
MLEFVLLSMSVHIGSRLFSLSKVASVLWFVHTMLGLSGPKGSCAVFLIKAYTSLLSKSEKEFV